MKPIKVKDVMTRKPWIVAPNQTVTEAAKYMKEIDCGVLPVGSAEKLVGMITDRDITLRVTAAGKDPAKTLVKDIMTKKVVTCDENESVEDAAEMMHDNDVYRLVITKNGKATGIVSMTCLLRNKGNLQISDNVLHGLLGREHRVS